MKKVDLTQLIEAGAHFGHLTRRWNPKMKPFIFMEKNGIHIIDLKKTQNYLFEAAENLSKMVSEGRKILFVGTKKQAKGVIESEARRADMNWVSERWLGGMLTNFSTIRKSIKRLNNIEKQETDGTFDKITKKERLFLTREKDKLKKVLEGVESMSRLPGALFVVDIKKEAIAVQEAHRLNIPVFAIVDTNCDPDEVDYVIPANDDAVKTIEVITKTMADAILAGTAKAKELKAEEAAEKERLKKEREAERKEEAARKSEAADAEKKTETE
jgi:small subunit ribosomal protein S2